MRQPSTGASPIDVPDEPLLPGESASLRVALYVTRSWSGEPIRVFHRPASHPGGPTVALVHGLEGTWDSWTGLVDRLPPDTDAYLLDLPWRAGSSHAWPHWGSSSTWLARGLDLLPAPPDFVVAHSFGASTVLDLLARCAPAERRPRRRSRSWSGTGRPGPAVHGVVLIAPLFRPGDAAVDPDFFGEAVTRFRGVLRDGMLAQLGRRAAGLSADLVDLMLAKVISRAEPAGFLQLYTLLSRLPALPLSTVDTPVLVISGVHDPSAPPPAARELARRLGTARLVQRARFGHFCQLEHAAEVAALITDFLRPGSPRTGSPRTGSLRTGSLRTGSLRTDVKRSSRAGQPSPRATAKEAATHA
jgi:pimeloyl-ACP methyl ester carboxylesterase